MKSLQGSGIDKNSLQEMNVGNNIPRQAKLCTACYSINGDIRLSMIANASSNLVSVEVSWLCGQNVFSFSKDVSCGLRILMLISIFFVVFKFGNKGKS